MSKEKYKTTFSQPEICCGKKNCTMCPHTDFWYMYVWNPLIKKLQSFYIGKKLAIYSLFIDENDKLKKIKV